MTVPVNGFGIKSVELAIPSSSLPSKPDDLRHISAYPSFNSDKRACAEIQYTLIPAKQATNSGLPSLSMAATVIARCLVGLITFFDSLLNLISFIPMVGATSILPVMYILSKVFLRETDEDIRLRATTLLAQWK